MKEDHGMITTLPSGSTKADLQTAINNASNDDTIVISNDMTLTEAVAIPAASTLTIRSSEGDNWVLKCNGELERHFLISDNAGLTLHEITLNGNKNGGIQVGDGPDGGKLTLGPGAVIQNCSAEAGGAIWSGSAGAEVIIDGGTVRNNKAADAGAGIYMNGGDLTINGGTIEHNYSYGDGGGVYMVGGNFTLTDSSVGNNQSVGNGGGVHLNNGVLDISGGAFSHNLGGNGGGVYVGADGIVNMDNAAVSNNAANIQGGGFYVENAGRLNISGPSIIKSNSAKSTDATQGGGGICTADEDYSNLSVGADTEFKDNKAHSGKCKLPAGKAALYPNLMFASVTSYTHPLNNNDINFSIVYQVAYDANGGTGSYTGPYIMTGYKDTVLSAADTGIDNPGFVLDSWNTADDGEGDSYAVGAEITLTGNVTLYALWKYKPEILPAEVQIIISKNAIGAKMIGGEFSFTLSEQGGAALHTVTNNANGLITFPVMKYSDTGVYRYAITETSAPAGWEMDDTVWPVDIKVYSGAGNKLGAVVSYPNGLPVFKNKSSGNTCGLVEFPELEFDAPGVYEYTMQELSPSGDGWTSDTSAVKVIITVIEDGHGNLVATVEYPDGYPSFVNTYVLKPVKIVLSACKIAIGAPLPANKFAFGLFDKNENLVYTVSNGSAQETPKNTPDEIDG